MNPIVTQHRFFHKRSTRIVFGLTLALLLFTQILLLPNLSLAVPSIRLGVMGDSGSDEYQANDNRGGTYHAVTFNWVEQLFKNRGVNVGAWGNYSEPRRTGFANNWARSGATSATLLSQGQHTGLAAQVAAGQIDVVIISIGNNDFAPYEANGYGPIYDGTLSGAALTAKINGVVANMTTAADTILHARPIPIIMATIANWNNSPMVYTDPRFTDPVKRQRVANAIASANSGLMAMAQARGISILDSDGVFNQIAGSIINGQLMVGGVAIQMYSSGDEPHNGTLGDKTHAGTVLEGIVADAYIQAMNAAAQAGLAPITEQEILANAGLSQAVQTPTPTPPPTTTPTPPPSNHAPLANNDSISMTHDTTITITYAQILSNDSDPDGDPISVIGGTLPHHGVLVPKSDGSGATYTPSSGYIGTDTFTYTISDGRGGTATGTVTITIQ